MFLALEKNKITNKGKRKIACNLKEKAIPKKIKDGISLFFIRKYIDDKLKVV